MSIPAPDSAPVLEPIAPSATWRDDAAYILPMVVYLGLTWIEGRFASALPWIYTGKVLIVAALLLIFRRRYTRITWHGWGLGIIVGAIVVVQWVGMEKLLGPYPRLGHRDALNPFHDIASPAARYAFIAIRLAGLALLVPVMEELFWRDWLWRTIAAPNNFRMVRIGEWDASAFIVVALAFASVHPEWITAIVCGVIYGALLLYTRSLGSVIIAHAVTNLLLGVYVLWTGDWVFW